MSDDEMSDDHDRDKAKDDHRNQHTQHAVECAGGATAADGNKALERSPSVRRKLRALAFGAHKKNAHPKESGGKKKKSSWTSKLNSRHKHISSDVSESSVSCSSCICTGYKKTNDGVIDLPNEKSSRPSSSKSADMVTLDDFHNVFASVSVPLAHRPNSDFFLVDDWDELARQERAKEIEEGIDPPPGFHVRMHQNANPRHQHQPVPLSELTMALSQQLSLSVAPYPYLERLTEAAGFSQAFFKFWERQLEGFQAFPSAHSQIDYVHCLVPDLLEITNCSFYWGKMDRYEAEKLLDKRPEGTFLLRDSAQEEFLFSVSFRRYGRTLHARIEQWNHKFSFDSHDPGVFASNTVCGLIEHYKDPSCCMFFEPMLTLPLNRSFVFPLQHLSRSVICSCLSYDGINTLNLPKKLKFYLKEYHYKQRVRVRRFDVDQ